MLDVTSTEARSLMLQTVKGPDPNYEA